RSLPHGLAQALSVLPPLPSPASWGSRPASYPAPGRHFPATTTPIAPRRRPQESIPGGRGGLGFRNRFFHGAANRRSAYLRPHEGRRSRLRPIEALPHF